MSYARRRKLGALGGALGAASVTALSTLALGGQLPADITHHAGAPHPAGGQTVVREVKVRRREEVAVAAPGAPARRTAAAPRRAGAAPARPVGSQGRRHQRPTGGRHPARHPAGPVAAAPGASGASALASGGYRGFASATAVVLSGGLTLARAASGVALDGHALDTADELGAVMGGLPADRTAFGRAIVLQAGAQDGGDAAGDGVATSSSPPAAEPTSDQLDSASSLLRALPLSLTGLQATSAARTDPKGTCLHGDALAAADARSTATEKAAQGGLLTLNDTAHSHTESLLDPGAGPHFALTTIAEVTPPDVVVAKGAGPETTVRFLGPVVLTVRAGGTAGSAAAELGPEGSDDAAPLVEVESAGQVLRYSAADVLKGGQTRAGGATITFGGAPHARGDAGAPAAVADDGTSASAAVDVLTVQAGDQRVTVGHVEASAAVPRGGIVC